MEQGCRGILAATLALFASGVAAACPLRAQPDLTKQDRLHLVLMKCDADGQRLQTPTCTAAADALLQFYGSEEAVGEAHGVFRMAIALPPGYRPAKAATEK